MGNALCVFANAVQVERVYWSIEWTSQKWFLPFKIVKQKNYHKMVWV